MATTCKTQCDCTQRRLACPICDEQGCKACNESGYFELTQCGRKYAAEMGELVHYADLYEKGLPPVAGGALDQSAWFTDAAQCFWHEKARAKNEAEERALKQVK